jgi:hypothetical protein
MLLGSRLVVDTGAVGSTGSSCTNLLDPTNLFGSDKTALISSIALFVRGDLMRAEVYQSHANGADFGAVVKVPVRMRRKRAMFRADCRACI